MSRAPKIQVHPAAAAEFDAAADWYRESSERAAEDFVAEVDQAIARITKTIPRGVLTCSAHAGAFCDTFLTR